MGGGGSKDKEQEKKDDANSRSYLLEVVAVFIWAALVMSCFSTFADKYPDTALYPDMPDYVGIMLTGCLILLIGAGIAAVFYACALPDVIKFIVAGVMVVGAIFILAAEGNMIDEYDSTVASTNCFVMSVGIFLVCYCCVIGAQMCTGFLSDEKFRIAAQAACIVLFCVMQMIFWFDDDVDTYIEDWVTDNEAANSIRGGIVILFIACLIAAIIGFFMDIKSGFTRFIVGGFIVVAAFIVLVPWMQASNKPAKCGWYPWSFNFNPAFGLSSTEDAEKLSAMCPGILMFMTSLVLGVDIMFAG